MNVKHLAVHPDTHARVKVAAAMNGITISEMVDAAILLYVRAQTPHTEVSTSDLLG